MRALQGLGTQDLEGLASSWRSGQGDSEAGHRLYVRQPRCSHFLRTGDAHDVKQDGVGMDHVKDDRGHGGCAACHRIVLRLALCA